MSFVVLWRVTGVCNLACPFCAYSRDLRFPRLTTDEGEVLRFGGILASEVRAGGDVLVSWLGGEPFLWQPIFEVSRRLRGDGIRISATSNATRLKPEALRTIAELFDEITLSLDGPEAFHDAIRGRAGNFEAIRAAVLGLRELRGEGGPKIRINTILMRGNVDDFPTFCETLAGWGVDELTFNQLGGTDRPEFWPENRLLPEQIDGLISALPALRARHPGLTIRGGPGYLRRLSATSRGVALPIADCGPGESFLFLDERGRITPCSFTSEDYGIPSSEIQSREDLLALPARFSAMRRSRRATSCEDCHSTQVFDKFVV